MSAPGASADRIPVSPPTPVVSVSPVTLPAPGRAVDLEMRISAPVSGDALPIVLLSHGQGFSNHLSSLDGYAPLATFWAAHGFVVIQPTHLSSARLRLDPDTAEGPMYWRSRAEDMTRIIDGLDAIEAAVPAIAGRLDTGRIAAAGHSMGGHTTSLLLGARVTDPHDGAEVDLHDPRIRAGVLLASTGRGGDAVTPFVAEHYPFLAATDFSRMTTPALVVAGDRDESSFLTVMGPAWHTDPYHLSPGPTCLLTLFGAEHGLGGVSGYDVAETTDENPERVAVIQRLTWAYLRSAMYPEDPAWADACSAFSSLPEPLGQIECKCGNDSSGTGSPE